MKIKLLQVAVCLGAALLSGLSVSAAERHVLQTRVPASARSAKTGSLPSTNRLYLSIGLPLRDKQAAVDLFQQVYDRRSTNFHRYLTAEQFAERFGPAEDDYQKVINYAKASRLEIVRTFTNRALVDVAGSVADIEGMFQVKMGTYRHPSEDRNFYAPDVEPSVEPGMPILFIEGLDNYIIPRHAGHRVPIDRDQGPIPNGGSDTNGRYMGSDFRHAYLPGTTLTGVGQTVGLFELEGYTPGDVTAYEQYAGLPNVLVSNVENTYAITLGTNSGNDEVALDIEMAIAMAPGLTQVSVYESTSSESILSAMAEPSKAGAPRPNQMSCSWGVEGDTNIVQGLIQLGLQGQSFFYAIGDSGAYPNGVNGNTEQSLLYMTAVGGTRLYMNGNGVSWSSEVVWNDGGPPTNNSYFASTGGVLTQVPIPYYQQTVNMSQNGGSTRYRSVPDVALVARDIVGYYTKTPSNGTAIPGQYSGFVGTSAAAPLWAGLLALVNQQGASQGSAPVGFLVPALYQIGESSLYTSCFHDITNGNNAWTNAPKATGTANLYYAKPGYDLCTGWGTSAGESLVDALIGYAGPVFVNFNYSGTQTGSYAQPFNTMAKGINAVSSGGTIIIETAGSSSETMTISKPMTIIANDGPATIGH